LTLRDLLKKLIQKCKTTSNRCDRFGDVPE
jgi:hypothetical protein